MDRSTRRSRRAGIALTALLVLAACGDDDASPSSDEPSAAAGDGSSDGPTIKVGYVNNEGGVVSLPEFRIGGEVAVDHINEHGGVNGASIELVGCEADGSPEGSINCANQLIDAGVVLAYTGIDVASDAALPLYASAGIPYVSSNSWGSAQRDHDNSFILHTAVAAFAVAPLQTFDQLGAEKIAVLTDQTPAAQDFMNEIVRPLGEDVLDFEIVEVPVDTASADYTQAVTTAMASDPDGILASLDETGCTGLVTATSSLGFDRPVMPGSCSAYVQELGEAAAGTYVFTDLYAPDTRELAPPEIQENLDLYEQAMTDAGHEDLIGGFANAPFSSMFELKAILETIDGPVTSQAVIDAFHAATSSPGFLGSDLHCGQPPVPSEPSHCRGDYLAFEIALDDSGNPVKEDVADGFQDVGELLG
jgi:branched-chain amino acid transport system substrate-binding protein